MATLADVLTELVDVVAVLQQESLGGAVKATLVQSLCQKNQRDGRVRRWHLAQAVRGGEGCCNGL